MTLSGFGTLGYSHEGSDRIGFMRNAIQPVSEHSNGSFKSDSVLGLQLNYAPTPQFEAVVQLLARHKQHLTLGNSMEWAFVAWHPNEAVDLRAGRMGLDVFLLSDYRSLGFSQPWLRPPTEFYGWIPFFSVNGLDAAYNFSTGETRWRLKAQAGTSASDIPLDQSNSFRFKADDLFTLTAHAEHGPWQFKAGYAAFTADSQPANFSQATDGLRQVITSPFPAIRDEATRLNNSFWLRGAHVRYSSVGAVYDDGNWLVQGEMAKISSTSRMLPTGKSGYATVARRFGSLTPYVGFARFKPETDAVVAENSWAALGNTAVTAQTVAVAAYNNYRIDQRTTTLGLRWDFDSRAALKVQWDRSRIGARGYGLWQVNNLVDGNTPQTVNLFSVSVDFVF